MIGQGGKVGGPGSGTPPAVPTDPSAPAAKEGAGPAKPGQTATAAPSDKFEAGAARAQAHPSGAPPAFNREASAATNLLQLARTNPAGALQLVGSLAGLASSTLGEIERELAGARALLAQLGAEKFSKEASDRVAGDLRQRREKVAALKLRYHMTARKMALLQQIAGKLGDPRLDEEIDRILQQHKKLRTDWGRRYHLLSLGGNLYSAEEGAPEHLKRVVKAEVRAGARSGEIADALSELSPRRAIAELMARSLDGTAAGSEETPAPALRGELGQTAQTYSFVRELADRSLEKDPLKKDSGS